jgi:hypothetical protein
MRKVVYSCLFAGSTANVDKPYVKDKLAGFDYVMFTNIPHALKNSGWTPIHRELLNSHAIYTSRFYKWTAHNFLFDYDVAIYVDAYLSPNIANNWEDIINSLDPTSANKGIIMMKHPLRKCIYRECAAIVSAKKDTRERMNTVIAFLRSNDMPSDYGLYECALFVRHLGNVQLNDMLEELFNLMLKYTYRDQALLTYIFWKNGVKPSNTLTKSYVCVTGQMGVHKYVQ